MSVVRYADVNPEVLAWARAESGWPSEQVARRLNVRPERIEQWERGDRKPTIRQVQNLARVFHRPLSILFLPSPPELPPLAAEYRRLPGVAVGEESPHLRLALRQMMNRREQALALMEEMGRDVQGFAGVASLSESPAQVGARLRALLRVSLETQMTWQSAWQAWRAWRAAVESLDVLVFQFGKVLLEEVRGVCLLDTVLPVVGINGREQVPEAKIFTLMHETVHLMLARGHEELPALREPRVGDQWLVVERFAESSASHALVPESALRSAVQSFMPDRGRWTLQQVRRLSRKFWITPLAMATRLRESGLMSWNGYEDWRAEWSEYLASLPARSGGIASPSEKALGRVGRSFAQLVLEAMAANRITSVDAARYLDLKFQHFDQLRDLLAGPGGQAGGPNA